MLPWLHDNTVVAIKSNSHNMGKCSIFSVKCIFIAKVRDFF